VTEIWRATEVAAAKLSLPFCTAVIVAVPAPTSVTVLPLTAATDGFVVV
jgi:hypothetical protein